LRIGARHPEGEGAEKRGAATMNPRSAGGHGTRRAALQQARAARLTPLLGIEKLLARNSSIRPRTCERVVPAAAMP